MGCCGSARYIPYGSIVASILVYLGAGLFCGSCLTALNSTEEMFALTGIAKLATPIIDYLKLTVYVLTPVMVFFALLYVLFGYLSTKQSKIQVYDNRSVCCGGMGCTSLALYVAYIVTFIWLVVGGASAIPVIFTYMVSQYTMTLSTPINGTVCVSLEQYGFVNLPSDTNNTDICGVNLKTFGERAGEAFLMFVLQLGGCLLIILGLIHFMMCLSANWGHLKDGLKRQDYETRRRLEEEELNEMGPSSVARGPRAKVYDSNMSQHSYNPNLPPIGGFGEPARHPSQPTMSTERLVNDYY
ncbi:neuronal membrane glycoprotein M6-a-like [Asterias amurensis]|uniref:neuronal membrane glycoprotein M6-a-like n=1 Tax=Asterias amurensis TaxID=7602 RepID=UPI003AB9022F